MLSRFIIYALTDPRTGEIRYVGKSTRGLKRTPEQCEKIAASKEAWWAARKAAGPLH